MCDQIEPIHLGRHFRDQLTLAFNVFSLLCILEHSDTSKAVSRLDDDERGTNTVRTPSGDQEMLVINESGLYSLPTPNPAIKF
nr:BRO family protein [Thalassospira sp. MCCC 1A01428]